MGALACPRIRGTVTRRVSPCVSGRLAQRCWLGMASAVRPGVEDCVGGRGCWAGVHADPSYVRRCFHWSCWWVLGSFCRRHSEVTHALSVGSRLAVCVSVYI